MRHLHDLSSLQNNPEVTQAQLECQLWGVQIPFSKVSVWHSIKYQWKDPYTSNFSTADSIHCQPEWVNKQGDIITGWFDMALINDGTGEETGIEGMLYSFLGAQTCSKVCLIQGTVLVASTSSSHFHSHPFQSSLTTMLRFQSIWSMFNGILNLPCLAQITSSTKCLLWKKMMDPLCAIWFLWPMYVAVFTFFLGLDSLSLWNGVVVMSWTYVICFS